MTKQVINIGTSVNKGNGDPLRTAFTKINENFTELYSALGLDVAPLNLGAFEFIGSTLSTTDSTPITIDQATTITSNLTVGGDVLPSVANGGDLGSSARPWKSLYVSNNTIFIGGVPLGLDANGALTVNGSQVTGGGGGSTLVNGANTVSLDANGNLTFPQGTLLGYSDPGGFIIDGAVDKDIAIYTYNGADAHGWTFGTDGSLTYPNGALQRDTGSVTCLGNASTMVYTTSSTSNQHTMKLLIQVEGFVGAASEFDTQACEMIIAKSFRANAISASVYGVVHTSIAPLATFTADWNPLTSKVEVVCTTPSANSVDVKIFATEITTSD